MTNTLITEHAAEQTTFLYRYKQDLLSTLQRAIVQAAQLHKAMIASFTLPIERFETIQAFAGVQRAGLGDVFFWEQPSEQNALIGVGNATTIETTGRASTADAATQWRALLQDAVISSTPDVQEQDAIYGRGPICFGGFAFDTMHARTSLWSGFPDGLLILPRFLLRYSKGTTTLTINIRLNEDDDAEQYFKRINDETHGLIRTIRNTTYVYTEAADALHIHDILSPDVWMQRVAQAASEIRAGQYEKVVLARSVEVTPATGVPFDVCAVLSRLRQSYPGTYIFALQRGTRFFVGATPERLVQAQNGQIHTMALAGTAPRGATPAEDQRLGEELLHSKKNAIEHAVVVARVREELLAHCNEVHVSDAPHLLKLKNVQHLETPIVGTLLPGRCILDVMGDLHPTPAVGGFPRATALATIRRIEGLDRGWYAGPLGWIGASGHGEFAVALRSGLLSPDKATLFAGCGIVGDSDPQSEFAESRLKFQVMLRGLGEQN